MIFPSTADPSCWKARPISRHSCRQYSTVQYSKGSTVQFSTVQGVQYSTGSTVLYSTVQYSTVQYSTVQYSTVQYSTVQYSTVQYREYSTVQYSTVQYSTVQYSTVQYSTVRGVQYTIHTFFCSPLYFAACSLATPCMFFTAASILETLEILHCTVLYCTVLYCTVLYCTVLYCTVLYCSQEIPFDKRYQDCEKLLWQIRSSDKGAYQTNIRLGKSDLIIRCRRKSGGHKWKEVPPLLIPHSAALPEVSLYKDKKMMSQSEDQQAAPKVAQPKLSNWLDDQEKEVQGENQHIVPKVVQPNPSNWLDGQEMEEQDLLPEANTLNGSISNHLQKNKENNKRKPSPSNNTTKKSKNANQEVQPLGIPTLKTPMGPPGPPIPLTPGTKKTTNKTIVTVHPEPTPIDMELDSNVQQLFDEPNTQGFTIIPKLVGKHPQKSKSQVSITKISHEESLVNHDG